jgi:hypothetical protein
MDDDNLRALLKMLDAKARDGLRRVLIRDQADRNAISSQLLRYRDQQGDDWADIIDMLTMHPDARRQVVRMLAEVDAAVPDLCRSRAATVPTAIRRRAKAAPMTRSGPRFR